MDFSTSEIDPSALFVNAAQLQQQMENISNMALSTGIEHYQNGQYKEAAQAFGRAIALMPTSSYATEAADYQASSFLKLGRTDKAVEAYETAIRLDPQNEASIVKLGNLLFAEQRFKEAEIAYQKAVRINPSSTTRYSLGQAYLANGNYNRAESEFSEVARLIPDDPNGFFGLAQTYAKQERYDKAVEYFNIAIGKDPEFYSANLELGIVLADAGRMDEATEQFEYLEEKDKALADQLSRYIYKTDKPKIMFASALSSFNFTMPMRTALSAIDSYLANANAEQTFTMIFQFDKEMDRESIENIYNWEIKRSDKSDSGNKYNYGLPIDDTEITLPLYPVNVYYDDKSLTATVRFTLTQNEEGNGTIDPSHVLFRFKGEDKYGNAMNSGHDEFTGFSRVI